MEVNKDERQLRNDESKNNQTSNNKFYQDFFTEDISNEFTKPNSTKENHQFFKIKETEEYQLQLQNLEIQIYDLQNDLREQIIKNSDLEYKIKERQVFYQSEVKDSEKNEVNIQKIKELEILLKESRKQNLIYADEIKNFKKREDNQEKNRKEIEYLTHENLTLKAFIVAQNKVTHYRHAFENLTIENYCSKCSESIQHMSNNLSNQLQNLDSKDIQVPEVNKSGHRNVVDLLKNSSTYTIQINNNSESLETVDKKFTKSTNEIVPSINKTYLRQMMDKSDLSADAIEKVARTVIHLGDQIIVRVDWDTEKTVRATVKYIGNLDERYQTRFFLGVKLNIKTSDIPPKIQNDGFFRKKAYFNLNSNSGYFLHFSNIVSIYNKETTQFEDFGDYLLKMVDPKASQNTRKNTVIKGLIEK